MRCSYPLAYALLAWVVSAVASQGGEPSQSPSDRRGISLDHVVVAVNDLDAMAARYRQMGFALKPGRPHDNGIRNQHVKFRDGTELELLTAPEARDDLTSRYRRHLAEGDGPAFLALFPRPEPPPQATKPDYVFFWRGNLSPTDRPEHFAHQNTAESLVAVWLASDDFTAERRLLDRYDVPTRRGRLEALDAAGDVASLDGGALYLFPARHRLHRDRPVIGVTFRVRNLNAASRLLGEAGLVARTLPDAVLVAPSTAGGLWLELRAAPTR